MVDPDKSERLVWYLLGLVFQMKSKSNKSSASVGILPRELEEIALEIGRARGFDEALERIVERVRMAELVPESRTLAFARKVLAGLLEEYFERGQPSESIKNLLEALPILAEFQRRKWLDLCEPKSWPEFGNAILNSGVSSGTCVHIEVEDHPFLLRNFCQVVKGLTAMAFEYENSWLCRLGNAVVKTEHLNRNGSTVMYTVLAYEPRLVGRTYAFDDFH